MVKLKNEEFAVYNCKLTTVYSDRMISDLYLLLKDIDKPERYLFSDLEAAINDTLNVDYDHLFLLVKPNNMGTHYITMALLDDYREVYYKKCKFIVQIVKEKNKYVIKIYDRRYFKRLCQL